MPPEKMTVDRGICRKVDAVVDRALAERRIVGAVVLASQDGKPVYRRAAGFIDRETARPMPADAIFRFSSLTKPIVAVAALALIDAGRAALDQPTTDWLPDFRPRLPDGSIPVITIGHLLTHTAGLSYGFQEPRGAQRYLAAGVSDGLDQPGLDLAENLRRVTTVPLSFSPGAGWAYSVATDVLGDIVGLERVHVPDL